MNTRQELTWDSIKAALAILLTREFQTPRILTLRGALEAVNKQIEEISASQRAWTNRSGTDGATITRLREELRRDHLLPISQSGQVLLKGMPGIRQLLRVPHKRTKNKVLLEETVRILDNARPYEGVFREAKFAPDFIEQAERAAAALAAKVADPDTAVGRRSAATHALKGPLAEGRKIIKSIDSIVATDLKADPAARKQWKKASRIPKKRGRPKDSTRRRKPPPD